MWGAERGCASDRGPSAQASGDIPAWSSVVFVAPDLLRFPSLQ